MRGAVLHLIHSCSLMNALAAAVLPACRIGPRQHCNVQIAQATTQGLWVVTLTRLPVQYLWHEILLFTVIWSDHEGCCRHVARCHIHVSSLAVYPKKHDHPHLVARSSASICCKSTSKLRMSLCLNQRTRARLSLAPCNTTVSTHSRALWL